MPTLSFVAPVDSPTATLRDKADRFFRSCKRAPVGTDANRLKDWRRGRSPLSFDMIESGLRRGGNREYARAIYLQKAAELVTDDSDVPPVEVVARQITEADVASDRAIRLALLDGQITPEERCEIEVTHIRERSIIDCLLERLRRGVRLAPPQQVGVRSW